MSALDISFKNSLKLLFALVLVYVCMDLYMMDGYHHQPKHHYKHHGSKYGNHHDKHYGQKHHKDFAKGHHGHSTGHFKKGHLDKGWKNWHFKKGYKHGYHAYGNQYGSGNKDYGHAAKQYGGHHKDHGDKHWGHHNGGHHGHNSGHKDGHNSHWWKGGEHKRSIDDSIMASMAGSQSALSKYAFTNNRNNTTAKPNIMLNPRLAYVNRQYPRSFLNNAGRIMLKEITLYEMIDRDEKMQPSDKNFDIINATNENNLFETLSSLKTSSSLHTQSKDALNGAAQSEYEDDGEEEETDDSYYDSEDDRSEEPSGDFESPFVASKQIALAAAKSKVSAK